MTSQITAMLHPDPDPLVLGIYGNGDYDGKRKPFPSAHIDDALSQNILYHSYEKPCTVEELAKLCGVPAYYIEDRIRHLLTYEAVVEATKGKYQTDFIIWSDKYGIYCEENAEKALMPIMDELLAALKEISSQAMKLDFYKAEKRETDLFYLFGVLAFSYASRKYCSLPYPWFKKRFDGNHWSYIGNMESGNAHTNRMQCSFIHIVKLLFQLFPTCRKPPGNRSFRYVQLIGDLLCRKAFVIVKNNDAAVDLRQHCDLCSEKII